MAELIKEFTNSMRLNGQVVRIARLVEGKDKNDKEFISYRGALKVGGEEGHLYDFEGMCYKLTKDGKIFLSATEIPEEELSEWREVKDPGQK